MARKKHDQDEGRDPLDVGPMSRTQKYVLAGAVVFICVFVLYYLFS